MHDRGTLANADFLGFGKKCIEFIYFKESVGIEATISLGDVVPF